MKSIVARNQPTYLSLTAAVILLFVSTWIIYSNILESPFYFDDISRIYNNPAIRMTSLSLAAIKKAAFNHYTSSSRPVGNISFALNYYFHQYNVTGYHILNIVLHALNGLLLYFFFIQTLAITKKANGSKFFHESSRQNNKTLLISFLAALLWVVHPLHTNSVTYIVQRYNSMAAFFYLSGMLCYIRGRTTLVARKKAFISGPSEKVASMPQSKRRLRQLPLVWFFTSIVFAILAFGSKQNAVMLPIMIALYEIFFFQSFRLSIILRYWKFIVATAVLFTSLAAFYLGNNPVEKLSSIKDFSQGKFTYCERVLTQPRVVFRYLSLLAYPHPDRLTFDYDFPLSTSILEPPETLLFFLLILGLLIMALYMAPKERLLSFCLLWFFGNLLLESSFVPLAIIFEHRTYIPSMFTVLLAVLIVYRIFPQRIATVLLSSIILLFSFWTYQRNEVWRDPIQFYLDCIDKAPLKARPHNDLGKLYLDAGDLGKARKHLTAALRLTPDENPDKSVTHTNMGNLLMTEKKGKRALEHYQLALRSNPQYSPAQMALGRAFEEMEDPIHAEEWYRKASESYMFSEKANFHLGRLLAKRNQIETAIFQYQTALKKKPDYAEAYNNLGALYIRQNHIEKAILQFQIAVRLKPEYREATNNLRSARSYLKSLEKAIDEINIHQANEPDNPILHFQLGELYTKRGSTSNAIEQYKAALRIDPEYIEAMERLAALYAKKKNIKKAIAWYQRINDREPENGRIQYNISCLHARNREFSQALYWLNKAIENGYNNRALIEKDPDIESLRALKAYREILDQIKD